MAGKKAYTWLKWSCLGLSLGSVLWAIFLMMTATHSLQQLADVVALQTGSSIAKPDITSYDGDHLLWRLQATQAVEEAGLVKLEQPHIMIYSFAGDAMPLQAAQGWYDKAAKTMQFKGDVQLQFQGWTLTSQRLNYDETTDEMVVDGAFILQQDGLMMRGKQLVITRKTGTMRVLQGVSMDIGQLQ